MTTLHNTISSTTSNPQKPLNSSYHWRNEKNLGFHGTQSRGRCDHKTHLYFSSQEPHRIRNELNRKSQSIASSSLPIHVCRNYGINVIQGLQAGMQPLNKAYINVLEIKHLHLIYVPIGEVQRSMYACM